MASTSGIIKKKSKEDLTQKFKDLTVLPIEDQCQFFLKSEIFALGDDWKAVIKIADTFKKYCKESGEAKEDLNEIQASDFLQKNGVERTAIQRKEEVRDIDLDSNGRICLVEFLLLYYKEMMLTEYYKRTGEKMPFTMTKGGIGITGVGPQLLDELFTMPAGLDPAIEAAIEEFTAKKKEREKKVDALRDKAAAGGVKGLAATNELQQMEQADNTEMNRIELTLNAAKRKASKGSSEQALEKKQKEQEAAKKKEQEESRARLKAKAAAFGQQ